MMMQRASERLFCDGVVTAATAFSRRGTLGGSLLSFWRDSGGSLAVRRIDDQRRAQVQGHRGLAPIQSELREVVVHVGDGAGFGLLLLLRGGLV